MRCVPKGASSLEEVDKDARTTHICLLEELGPKKDCGKDVDDHCGFFVRALAFTFDCDACVAIYGILRW